jgi:two-component system, response regulator RegA
MNSSGQGKSLSSSAAKRVLIIDDDDASIFGYTRFLAKAGFTVDSESYLLKGLQKLAKGPFDAAVFDVHLPDGNALEALSDVRARHPSIKIFVISGTSDPVVAQTALARGADRFLVKPVSIEELCDIIIVTLEPDQRNGQK